MKKIQLIILIVCTTVLCQAQLNENPLNTKDSLLSTYISSSMENFYGWDSCFAGIYFIKFSLANDGDIIKFEASALMPLPFKLEIEKKIKELKGKWALSFLNDVLKGNRSILQPIFIHYDKECTYKDNFYSKKLDTDSLGDNYSCTLAQAALINFSLLLLSTKETFMQAMKLEGGKGFLDCILMSPSLITPKAKVFKGSRVD